MLTGLDPTREPACAPMWKSHAEALSYVLRNRRSRTHKFNSEVLFGHRDRPDHVRVEPAVILNRAGRLEHDPAFGVGRHHYIPGTISGSRGVGNDIVVHPLDSIADMGGNLCRRVGDLRHLDLD